MASLKELGRTPEFMAQLKRHEGSVKNRQGKHEAYVCPAGALTIGYGHNLTANPVEGLGKGSVIDEEAAERLLAMDVGRMAGSVELAFPWTCGLNLPRAGALVNMAFNMGLGNLRTFKMMLGAMQNKNFDDAAHFCIYRADRISLSRWVLQVKGRAWELATQIRTGEWQKGFEPWMKF